MFRILEAKIGSTWERQVQGGLDWLWWPMGAQQDA